MKQIDKRFADLTPRDVRSYFRRVVGYFLLGCIIGVVLLIALASSQAHAGTDGKLSIRTQSIAMTEVLFQFEIDRDAGLTEIQASHQVEAQDFSAQILHKKQVLSLERDVYQQKRLWSPTYLSSRYAFYATVKSTEHALREKKAMSEKR